METAVKAAESTKQRRIFQALSPECPRMLATVQLPAKDGLAPVSKVKEMDRLGRYEVKEDELYYDEQLAALRKFCVRKPHLLREVRQGVEAEMLAAGAVFGRKKTEMEEIQEVKRIAASATEERNAMAGQVEAKDKTIADLQARLAKLEKGNR